MSDLGFRFPNSEPMRVFPWWRTSKDVKLNIAPGLSTPTTIVFPHPCSHIDDETFRWPLSFLELLWMSALFYESLGLLVAGLDNDLKNKWHSGCWVLANFTKRWLDFKNYRIVAGLHFRLLKRWRPSISGSFFDVFVDCKKWLET